MTEHPFAVAARTGAGLLPSVTLRGEPDDAHGASASGSRRSGICPAPVLPA
ncbi:hypothetical protein [Frankia sp. AiPa1]|uniref:hypothetical protein n=1 Tax=Frankia sp. AiPa1 TaxID=573492 RepID=UPI00202B41FE|nr:hypothetical protein [Frankia sp. AiPa1]MCL9757935.1 hypothetical protein [Frankia sp. AiPa1]